MRKFLSTLVLLSMLTSLSAPLINTVNADLTMKKVRVVVTYPVSDTGLGVDAGSLVHEPNSGVVFRFALKDSGGSTLCMEEKSLPVVNGIMTYDLGSQFSININGVTTGCNMSSLINNSQYKVVVTGDLNKDNDFNDDIDYTSEEAVWVETSNQQFEDSFLDSKVLDMMNSISNGSGSSTTNNYSSATTELNKDLIANGSKTKTFDLNKDSISEIISKNTSTTTNPGIIYTINKDTGNYENVYSSTILSLDDSTNIFLDGKENNYILVYTTFGTDPSITKKNFSTTAIKMVNSTVLQGTLYVKEFVAYDYAMVTIAGEDKLFKFSNLSRVYEEQITINYGISSNLYDSLTDSDWSGTPFISESTDYYGGDEREAYVNNTNVTDVDGIIYSDFNEDGKLDFVTYKNSTGGKAYFSIYLGIGDGSTHKLILNNVLGDGITAGTSLIDNSSDFGGKDIKEIIITNGLTKNIYKINGAWEANLLGDGDTYTVKRIASFDSAFYAILSNTGGTNNINLDYFSIGNGFRDMDDSKINDKFLLVGNFKATKDGYDYYDYSLKQFNGSEFIDLTLFGSTDGFKLAGNKIGFTKIANSKFFVFYIDQSTNYTKGKQDKTNLYYVKNGKIVPVLSSVTVNNNNTVSTQDGNLNEGGSKLLNNSKFGYFDQNITDITSGTLGLSASGSISNGGGATLQYEEGGYRYYLVNSNGDILNNMGVYGLNTVFSKFVDTKPIYFKLSDIYKNSEKGLVYDGIKTLTYGIGNTETISGKTLITESDIPIYNKDTTNLSNYISADNYNTYFTNLYLGHDKSTRNIIFSNNLINQPVYNYGTDKYVHTVDNLKGSYFTTVNNYIYKDNGFTNTGSQVGDILYYVGSDNFIHKTFLDGNQTSNDKIIYSYSSKELKQMGTNIYFINNADGSSLYKIDTNNNDAVSKITGPTNLRHTLNYVGTRFFMTNNNNQVVVYDASTGIFNNLTNVPVNSVRPLLARDGSYYWIKYKYDYYNEKRYYFTLDANLNASVYSNNNMIDTNYANVYSNSLNLSTGNTDGRNGAVNTSFGFTYSYSYNRYHTDVSSNGGQKIGNYLIFSSISDSGKLYKFDLGNFNYQQSPSNYTSFSYNTHDRKITNFTTNFPTVITGNNSYKGNNYIISNTDNIYFIPSVSNYSEKGSLKPFLDTNGSKRLNKIVWGDMNWNSNSSNSEAGTINLNSGYSQTLSDRTITALGQHSWRWSRQSVTGCNASGDANLESKFGPYAAGCWMYQGGGWYKFFPLY